MTTLIVKHLGVGKDFTSWQEFQTFIRAQDLVANDHTGILYVHENFPVLPTVALYPLTFDANHTWLIRPAEGLGVNDLDNVGPLDYGIQGIELVRQLQAGTSFSVGHGMILEGFRITVTGEIAGTGIMIARSGSTASTANGIHNACMRKCRIKYTGNAVGAYAVSNVLATSHAQMYDNLFINEGAAGNLLSSARTNNVERNTFVSRGAAAGRSAVVILGNDGSIYRDNLFAGCGDKPINRDSYSPSTLSNNFTDAAITGIATGFSVVAQTVEVVASDLRPKAGSLLIGGASASSQFTSDIRNVFRGATPDVGASMLSATAAPAKPDVTITDIVVYGQKVTVNFTFTNNVDTASAIMQVAGVPNGAVEITTNPTIQGVNGGTGSAIFVNVQPGNYLTPDINLTNQGGSGTCTGGAPVTVDVPAVPTMAITGQAKNGSTVTINGTHTGPIVSGTLTLPAAAIPNGAITKGPLPINVADNGTWSIVMTAVAYGNYDEPTVSGTNFSGTANASGNAMQLYAPGSQPPGLPSVDLPAYSVPVFNNQSIAIDAKITDVELISTTGAAQTNVPFTFGQNFKKGELSPSDFIIGKIAGEADVPLQFNTKSTFRDGSLRHAIITGVVPALAANQTKVMDLHRVAAGTVSMDPISSDVLTTAGFNCVATANINGTPYTASPNAALAAGVTGNGVWLEGALATEWIVHVPFSSGGTDHPMLTAQFAVRYYPGVEPKARVDVSFEHTKAYDSLADITYDASFTINGVEKFSQSNMIHFPCARGKARGWWNAEPMIHVKHNARYLIDTKAVANYDPRIIMTETALADMGTQAASPSLFKMMEVGVIKTYMPDTGGRKEIAILPSFAAATALTMDKRAYDLTMKQADVAGSWSIHRRDTSIGPGNGMPISVINFPYATLLGNLGDTKNPATGQYELFYSHNTTSVLGDDSAHQPSLAYLPYILTGDYYYLEELQFWATRNSYENNPVWRQYAKGSVAGGQCRAQGWTIRTLGDAAAVTPDNHPLKTHFEYWLDSTLQIHNARTVDSPQSATLLGFNPTDIVYNFSADGLPNTGVGPWQDDFFTQGVGHVAELDYPEAARLLAWKAKFQVGRMIDPGFCYLNATMYRMRVRDTEASPFYTSLNECIANSISPEEHAEACGSPERLAVRNAQRAMPSNPWLPKQIGGSDPRSYTGNYQPALAMTVDTGYPDADLAWMLYDERDMPNDYSAEPQFGIVPRGVSLVELPPAVVTDVLITPNTVSVTGGSFQVFNAQVIGTNNPSQQVTWTTTGGTISINGYFVAPAATSVEQIITVSATSNADPSITGTATVTVPAAVQSTVRYVEVFLKSSNGSAMPAQSGLKWAWFDQSTPGSFGAPANQGTNATVEAGTGKVKILLPNTTFGVNDVGWLEITNSNGNPSSNHRAFSGPVKVK